MKLTSGTTITRGSGDVIADLGFSPSESRNLRIRSQMMTALRKFIEKEGLTQSHAAKRLKVTQPRPGGQILINPAQNSKALLVAKCFCTGDWSEWKKEQPVGRTN